MGRIGSSHSLWEGVDLSATVRIERASLPYRGGAELRYFDSRATRTLGRAYGCIIDLHGELCRPVDN